MKRLRSRPEHRGALVLAARFAFPVLWFMLSSFKPGSELFSLPLTLFPENWTVSGYATAWTRFDFAQYFVNTAIVALVTTALTVLVSAMTGYALAKYKAWWLKVFFICILATTMLPTEVIMPLVRGDPRPRPVQHPRRHHRAVDPHRDRHLHVPAVLQDGSGRAAGGGAHRRRRSPGVLRIMLPLAKPIAIVLAIFSFQWRWNDYIWPLIVLNDPNQYTLQIALRSIVGADNIDWSVLLSASVISLIPMVILFVVFQRQIMSADINSGLKD